MPNQSAILTILLIIALILGGTWVGQNVNLLPLDASTNASVYDELFKVLFSIGTILFVGMVALVVYSLIRFRRKSGDLGDGIAIEENLPLEIFWTAVPTIVILFVGLYSYDIYDRMGGMQALPQGGHNHQAMTNEKKIWGGIGSGSIESSSTNKMTIVGTAVQKISRGKLSSIAIPSPTSPGFLLKRIRLYPTNPTIPRNSIVPMLNKTLKSSSYTAALELASTGKRFTFWPIHVPPISKAIINAVIKMAEDFGTIKLLFF